MRKKLIAAIAAVLMLVTCIASSACGSTSEEPPKQSSANEFTDNRMMMGMYHLTPVLDSVKNQIKFQDAIDGDEYNVFLMGRHEIPDEKQFDEYCTKIYEAGKRFFLFDSTQLWNGSAGYAVHKDIYVRLHQMKETLRSKSYYDAFLGYYVDEPLLLGIPLTELYEASKAFRTTFPDKRFMVVFSAAGISTEYDIGAGKDRLTREGGEYITDIGFDIYGAFGDYWNDIWDTMTEMFEGQDKNYWAVPMVMNYRGRVTEDDAIGSLEGCWNVVKNAKDGMGMMLYNAYTYPAEVENIGNIGFCDMAYTSKEEFMTWKNKGDPWKKYYNKFYTDDGAQVTEGVDFVPWTRLDEKIKSLSAEIAKLNENKIVKAETEIVCADGQSFVYDSLPHTPVLGEYIPNTVCRFAQGQSDEWTDTAPSAKGSYRMKVTVEESLYRKAAEKIISFTIVESAETMVSANLITEDYVSEKKTVRFNVEGYTVSLNGIDYVPYGRNSEIDVTSMIGNGGRPKYVWLKEGNKAPFGYRVKQYDRIMIQDFEKGTVPAYSNYKPSGIVRKEGNYSGQLDLKYNASEGKYTSELRFIDMNYPMNGQNLYSIAGSTQVEFWMYTDKEITVTMWLIADNWNAAATLQTITVEKNTWMRVTFDFARFQDMSATVEYAMSHMLQFTLVIGGEPKNVFIDSLCVVGLK